MECATQSSDQSREALPLDLLDLGRVDYERALQTQKDLLLKRQKGLIPDTMILCEHEEIITLGRGAQRARPKLPARMKSLDVERGGLATYHGPGQLVAYFIVKLAPARESRFQGGLKEFVCAMEKGLISYLKKEHEINAHRIDGKTGVWIEDERKIASIGVAVSRWVSYHGLAINLSTPKSAWLGFDPCGFDSSIMTNLESEIENSLDFAHEKQLIKKHLLEHFR